MRQLNFGCGTDIREGWDNVDIQSGKGVDLAFDFDKFPYPFPENTYNHILMKAVIEHVIYPDRVLLELHKCCKNKATIEITTDHYSNNGAYSSLEHQHYLNELAFTSFVEYTHLHTKRPFKIIKLEITPTWVGMFFPRWIRNKLSLFINGLHSQIHVIYEVEK